MLVVVRADASPAIGAGHVARCISLANELQERGARVIFVGACDIGNLRVKLAENGHSHSQLTMAAESSIGNYQLERGEDWEYDAAATAAIIRSFAEKPEWLIVDHYSLDSRWCAEIRPLVERIMVIDDLADRPHDADVLLDQNLVAAMESRYNGKLPEGCVTLLGPYWALLQPQYAKTRSVAVPRSGPIKNILVSFGGADSFNLTGRTIDALLTLNTGVKIDVVVASEHSRISEMQTSIAGRPNFNLHFDVSSLAPFISRADLAIGACGSSAWERLCLGLPTVVITFASNQVPLASELHVRGLVRWLGDEAAVAVADLSAAIGSLLRAGLDEGWSNACANIVDGLGAMRVGDALTLNSSSPLHARRAVAADEDLLLQWANDPVTRRNAFNPERIDSAVHRRWFAKRLTDIFGCRLFVIESQRQVAVGQVRFERHADTWEVHYSLAPQFRGRGLGAAMLRAAVDSFRKEFGEALIFGKVKRDNQRSRRVFVSLDFKEEPLDPDTLIFRLSGERASNSIGSMV